MPTEFTINRPLWEHQQRLVEQAMPANNRTIRFELISDEHSPLSDESQATLRQLRDRAAARVEREILEQMFQAQPQPTFVADEGSPVNFTMEYMNSWGGDFIESERRVAEDRQHRVGEPAAPQDRNSTFRTMYGGTVTGRMSSSEAAAASLVTRRATPAFDKDAAIQRLIEQGYDDYAVVLEIPGPFADAQTVGVLECVRDNPSGPAGNVQRRYFSFARVSSRDLQVLNIKSEAEYISDLRRRNRDVSHFYAAQTEGRRRMAAKILSGGAEKYQLLLNVVVDDDTLRVNLSSREYRRKMASHEERVKAASQRMVVIKRQLRDANHVSTAAPEPATERGQRAANAARRRQDSEQRRSRPRGIRPSDAILNGSW